MVISEAAIKSSFKSSTTSKIMCTGFNTIMMMMCGEVILRGDQGGCHQRLGQRQVLQDHNA
jgi:hypothetical protein